MPRGAPFSSPNVRIGRRLADHAKCFSRQLCRAAEFLRLPSPRLGLTSQLTWFQVSLTWARTGCNPCFSLAWIAAEPPMPINEPEINLSAVLIDCDPGWDDALALVLLLA